jgi:uncharacterized protein (DUF433 family)
MRGLSDIGQTLLDAGIYTIPEAAELVGADKRALRVWVEGHKGKQEPVIENQIGRIGRTVAVSFINLMELRFVSVFANAGVGLREIRAILKEFRVETNKPHPLATNIVFRTDGRKIFGEIAKKNGVDLFGVRSGQHEMIPVVVASLKNDVRYDPRGDAVYWKPRAKIAPNVIIHPSFSFGQPIIRASRIPTETLAKAFAVEGNAKFVAAIYEVPEAQVREAVKFERELRNAA